MTTVDEMSAATEVEVRHAIARLTATYTLDQPPKYNPDIWAEDRAAGKWVPTTEPVAAVWMRLASRADVHRMAESLGLTPEDEYRITELPDGPGHRDEWWAAWTTRFRMVDWLPGVTLRAYFEEGRLASKPRAPRRPRTSAR